MSKIVRSKQAAIPTLAAVVLGFLLLAAGFYYQTTGALQVSVAPRANFKATRTNNSSTLPNELQKKQNTDMAPHSEITPEITEQCRLTLGDWCTSYKTQPEIAWHPPPRGNKECLWNCNGVGVCDAIKGFCFCPAGWQGDACDVRMPRPCGQKWRAGGFEPYDDPNIDWSMGGIAARCAGGECDDDIGLCYCPANSTYGRIPAAITAPPGTPPTRMGRPMGMHCQPNEKPDGSPTRFGDLSLEEIRSWCNDPKPKKTCPCYHDHLGGKLCDKVKEAFCPNQCNGHGECYLGFCKCQEGWFGHDCAYRMQGVEWTPGLEKERPWLKDVVHTPAAKDPEPGARRNRPLIYVYELPPRYHSHLMQYRNDGGLCHHRCFHGDNNESITVNAGYGLETGLHEYLLQSEHRTLDPEEADWFYIPMYITCFMMPVQGWADFPWFHGGPAGSRAMQATNMMIETWSWLRSHYPYWDRNGGRDHFLLSAHDEGSCYVPEVLRNATILAHWGYTGYNNKSFTNYGADIFDVEFVHPQYMPEGYLSKLGLYKCIDPKKDLVVPLLWAPEKYGSSLLFGAPARERSIFAMHKGRVMHEFPVYSRGSRQKLNNLTVQNDWWQKHKIYIGSENPPGVEGSYSELLAATVFCPVLMGDGWSARFDDAVVHGQVQNLTQTKFQNATHVRANNSFLCRCIPVIIMDDVLVSFESIIDITKFSVRLSFADMEYLPEKLLAIDKKKIKEMQNNIAKVWRRYFYSSLKAYTPVVQRYLDRHKENAGKGSLEEENSAVSFPLPAKDYNPAEDDAFATIIQWLYSRRDIRY